MNNLNKIEVSRLLGLLTNTKTQNNLLALIEEKDSEIDYLKTKNLTLKEELSEATQIIRMFADKFEKAGIIHIKDNKLSETNFRKEKGEVHV